MHHVEEALRQVEPAGILHLDADGQSRAQLPGGLDHGLGHVTGVHVESTLSHGTGHFTGTTADIRHPATSCTGRFEGVED